MIPQIDALTLMFNGDVIYHTCDVLGDCILFLKICNHFFLPPLYSISKSSFI